MAVTDINKEEKKEEKKKVEPSIEFDVPVKVEQPKKQERKPIKIPPTIGLYNRKNFDVHVIFTDKDILLSPGRRTTKIYNESEILSVQGKSLQTAIAEGIISILR